MTTIALRTLEKDVEKFASVIEDEDKRKNVIRRIMDSDDPIGAFRQAQDMKDILLKALGVGGIGVDDDDDVETPPPAGSARAPPKSSLWTSGKEAIDAIYGILENPKSSEQEKAAARRKADELVQQFISGRQKAIRENPQHKYYVGFSMCPKCLKSIFVNKGDKRVKECPHCGAILTKRAE